VSPSECPASWPQLYVCLVFCLLSFLHLPSPSVRFLGQAHLVLEKYWLSLTPPSVPIISLPAPSKQLQKVSLFYIMYFYKAH
jgi:hypothetical protein